MLISRRQEPITSSICIGVIILDLTREINILGVQFDNQLTLASHMKDEAERKLAYMKDEAERSARRLAYVRRTS